VDTSLGKKLESSPQITRAQSAGGIAQVVGHLDSKLEALSSNPNTVPPKKIKRFNELSSLCLVVSKLSLL
jgi:hypothetical protein